MIRMIDSADELTTSLESYIQAEEQRLGKLRQAFGVMRSHLVAASVERERHLNNPINFYFLIRRISADWSSVKALVITTAAGDLIRNMQDSVPLPDDEDVEGASVALLRLQDMYQLNAAQISSGMLSATYGSPEFTAWDCYELGRSAYLRGDHYHTVLWMEEAMRRLDREQESRRTIDRIVLLDHLRHSALLVPLDGTYERTTGVSMLVICSGMGLPSSAHVFVFQQGNARHSLALINEMLTINPAHDRAPMDKAVVEGMLATQQQGEAGDGWEMDQLGPMKNDRPASDDASERDRYEALCRGEGVMDDPARVSELKCFYLTRSNPRLLLSPAKAEEVFDRPPMLLFHDILLASEMELFKTMATSRLQRAMDVNRTTYEDVVTHKRTSKRYLQLARPRWTETHHRGHAHCHARRPAPSSSEGTPPSASAVHREAIGRNHMPFSATCRCVPHSRGWLMPGDHHSSEHTSNRLDPGWLMDGDHEAIATTNKRFEDYTGLDVSTAEPHQMANYGLGGHFEPHCDFTTPGVINSINTVARGNRIATLLVYMSDVEAGGATVFPNIGARIVPRKGTAVFWFNLRRSGEGIDDSRHAACPVLMGNKWAVNKWFHERGQEFRRPCSLDPAE